MRIDDKYQIPTGINRQVITYKTRRMEISELKKYFYDTIFSYST